MSENAVMYAAVYDDTGTALADLDAFEQLHTQKLLGDFDAAVVDKEDGHPHIVKRVDRPRIHVIPELVGAGVLKRKELHELADELGENEAALVVVGEPTLEKGFDQAVTHAAKTMQHEFDTATDALAEELKQGEKS
jgi:nucleotide-binding universal stress UspA family protein